MTREDDVGPVLYVSCYSSDGGQSARRHVRCRDDLGPHQRGWYVLVLVVALPRANSHSQSIICSECLHACTLAKE